VTGSLCGRFSLTVEGNAIAEYFRIRDLSVQYQPDHNIAPGQMIPVITGTYDKRRLSLMRWGLKKEHNLCAPLNYILAATYSPGMSQYHQRWRA
jgi:hypothetical protein